MKHTILVAALAVVGLAGCSKEESKPAPAPAAVTAPAPASPPTPAPAPTTDVAKDSTKTSTEAPKVEAPKADPGRDAKK